MRVAHLARETGGAGPGSGPLGRSSSVHGRSCGVASPRCLRPPLRPAPQSGVVPPSELPGPADADPTPRGDFDRRPASSGIRGRCAVCAVAAKPTLSCPPRSFLRTSEGTRRPVSRSAPSSRPCHILRQTELSKDWPASTFGRSGSGASAGRVTRMGLSTKTPFAETLTAPAGGQVPRAMWARSRPLRADTAPGSRATPTRRPAVGPRVATLPWLSVADPRPPRRRPDTAWLSHGHVQPGWRPRAQARTQEVSRET